MVILHLCWIFLKLVREKEVISPSSYLDVLKIRMERRGEEMIKIDKFTPILKWTCNIGLLLI